MYPIGLDVSRILNRAFIVHRIVARKLQFVGFLYYWTKKEWRPYPSGLHSMPCYSGRPGSVAVSFPAFLREASAAFIALSIGDFSAVNTCP